MHIISFKLHDISMKYSNVTDEENEAQRVETQRSQSGLWTEFYSVLLQ